MSIRSKSFLVAGKRTPFGKFGGFLKNKTPVELSLDCSRALFEACEINPNKIDHIIFGNVIPSTTDTLYSARHIGLKLGVPKETPGYSVNRLCGSGIECILSAKRLIEVGESECVLVSGSENMSLTPHLLYGGRFGTKYGPLSSVDFLTDALTDKHCNLPMAITAENLALDYKISRTECDEFALRSQKKAIEAHRAGKLSEEIVPILIKKKELKMDEHIRPESSIEEMVSLQATFKENGVVTAGNASGIVDGAASVIVASEEFCEKSGVTPLAEIIDGCVIGVAPEVMGIGPVPAILKLLKKNNLNIKDINLFEINEAFAAQTLSCIKELGINEDILNVWGGAIAIGHPLGATGVRISLTLARQLKLLGGEMGIASACIGGGQGIAILLRNI